MSARVFTHVHANCDTLGKRPGALLGAPWRVAYCVDVHTKWHAGPATEKYVYLLDQIF